MKQMIEMLKRMSHHYMFQSEYESKSQNFSKKKVQQETKRRTAGRKEIVRGNRKPQPTPALDDIVDDSKQFMIN
jgi:hypothetical protein